MLDKSPETRIHPSEALSHPYFKMMEVEEALSDLSNYPNSPLLHKSLMDRANFQPNIQSPQLKYKPSFAEKQYH